MPRYKVATYFPKDHWVMCKIGYDRKGNQYSVYVDERPTQTAKDDAALIAKLLNWYYADPTTAEQVIKGEISEL